MTQESGTLFVVATPIGNLDDLTLRARATLERAGLVAAEDTRRGAKLLSHLGLQKRLLSLHEHNEEARVEQLFEVLAQGEDVALISDAGTPLISDPGYRVLERARRDGIPVSPVPGCCAAIAALSIAGLPTDRFTFAGFLPAKASARRAQLGALCQSVETIVLYESVHRVEDLLSDIQDIAGPERPITLTRELTKLYETIYRGSVAEVRRAWADDPGGRKGEFTLVMAGAPVDTADTDEARQMIATLLEEVSARQAASIAARLLGMPRREAYAIANALKNNGSD